MQIDCPWHYAVSFALIATPHLMYDDALARTGWGASLLSRTRLVTPGAAAVIKTTADPQIPFVRPSVSGARTQKAPARISAGRGF